MKELASLGEMALELVRAEVRMGLAAHHALKSAAAEIAKDAKAAIGEYQQSAGPFPAWSELADSTEAEKARLGYPSDAPLLREGDLRESIQSEVHGLEAVVGSKSEVAAAQEFGTDRIPPRPFIGPAAFKNKDRIEEKLGKAIVSGLVGGDPIHPLLGYNITS
ncbi:phage virion morphogenesis protein [Chitinimonas naiadis]